MSKKIESIVVDTLTGLQVKQWMSMSKKPDYDQWFDFGKDIYIFMIELQKMGFELVLILGSPGSGKTFGMKSLDPESNIWYNTDAKLPSFKGGRKAYGTLKAPSKNHVLPSTYSQIIADIKGRGKDAYGELPIAFLTAHTEDFKSGRDSRVRLKTLGKVATKMQLEGLCNNVFYTRVDTEEGAPKFVFETQNNGFNTARSYEEMLPDIIPNDYQMILEAIQNY